MLVQANRKLSLSKWWAPGWAPLDASGIWEGLHRIGRNSSSFTTEFGEVVDLPPWWPIQSRRCSRWPAVSVGMSEVVLPSLSLGKGTAFCLLASGPQGFISSFQPQTRGCVNDRSEERSQRPVPEHTK